jgi:hypothetical protein
MALQMIVLGRQTLISGLGPQHVSILGVAALPGSQR